MVVTLLEPVSCLNWPSLKFLWIKASTFVAEVELQRGDTLVIHYENSPCIVNDQSNNRAKHIARVSGQLIDMFRDDPELGAAWMKALIRI